MRLLVTRPVDEAGDLSARLAALGHEPVLQPLLHIETMAGPPLDLSGVAGFLVTSGNGARALAQRTAERGLPLLAVGDRTAALARDLGFTDVASAGGDVTDLALLAQTRSWPAGAVLLHAAGETRAGDLAAALKPAGLRVRVETLYRAVAAEAFEPAVSTQLAQGRLDGVLLFSPRTAAVWRRLVTAEQLEPGASRLAAYCLSPAVAAEIAQLHLRSLHTASEPTTDKLLALLTDTARAGG